MFVFSHSLWVGHSQNSLAMVWILLPLLTINLWAEAVTPIFEAKKMYHTSHNSLLKRVTKEKKCQALQKVIKAASELSYLEMLWDYRRSHHEASLQDCSWKVLPLCIIHVFHFHTAESNMGSPTTHISTSFHLSGKKKKLWLNKNQYAGTKTESSRQTQFRWNAVDIHQPMT